MSLVDEVSRAEALLRENAAHIEALQETTITLQQQVAELERRMEPEPEPTPDPTEPEEPSGDHKIFKPANGVLSLTGDSQIQPGQTVIIDAPDGTIRKIVIDGVQGTMADPVTIRLERPTVMAVDQHTYWQNNKHIKFDMRFSGVPALEFRDRVFIRHSSYLEFYGFKSSCPDQVSWMCKPLIADEKFDSFLWDNCEFSAPNGEGIYIGGNGADPTRNYYLMRDVTVRNCIFRGCGEGFHVAGVVGFLLENNLIEDTLIAKPGAHNAAISIGRGSYDGKVVNNIIRRSRGCGFNVLAGDGFMEFIENEIDTVGTGVGDPDLGKHIYGIRAQTGNGNLWQIRENTFRNIATAAVQFGGAFGARAALEEQIKIANTFVNVAKLIE
jgi:hypothetical protein